MLLENILLLLDLIYYLSRGLMLPKEKKKTFIMTVVSCRSDLLSFKGGNSTKREQENIYHDLFLVDQIYYRSREVIQPKEKKKTFSMTVVSCRSDLLSFKGGNSTNREQENIYHDLFLVDQIYYRSREVIQPKEKKTFIITVVSEITRFHEYG
jgi:hypothetical protein